MGQNTAYSSVSERLTQSLIWKSTFHLHTNSTRINDRYFLSCQLYQSAEYSRYLFQPISFTVSINKHLVSVKLWNCGFLGCHFNAHFHSSISSVLQAVTRCHSTPEAKWIKKKNYSQKPCKCSYPHRNCLCTSYIPQTRGRYDDMEK